VGAMRPRCSSDVHNLPELLAFLSLNPNNDQTEAVYPGR
jgi:hypothetical protein